MTVDINRAEPNEQEGKDDMSDTPVIGIIERAVSDEAFRHLLLSNPEEALSGYALTAEQHVLLLGLNENNFDEFAGTLGDRATKGTWIPGTG